MELSGIRTVQQRWWNSETKAVVTGANRGIGLEIAKLLADQGLSVILTARCEKAGQEATNSLVKDHAHRNVYFHQLDVRSDASVSCFAEWMKTNHSELHILINNAAVLGTKIDWGLWEKRGVSARALLMDRTLTEGFMEDYSTTEDCIETNYFGVKRMVKAMLPLMRGAALHGKCRIVNVSSNGGMLLNLKNPQMRRNLEDPEKLREETIDEFVRGYLEDAKSGQNMGCKEWPSRFTSYIVSKISVNAYTRVVAREEKEKGVSVNCVHPGSFVSTGMTCMQGEMAPSEAAGHVVKLALLHPHALQTGLFYLMDVPSPF